MDYADFCFVRKGKIGTQMYATHSVGTSGEVGCALGFGQDFVLGFGFWDFCFGDWVWLVICR